MLYWDGIVGPSFYAFKREKVVYEFEMQTGKPVAADPPAADNGNDLDIEPLARDPDKFTDADL
jgi:hypothetical protein